MRRVDLSGQLEWLIDQNYPEPQARTFDVSFASCRKRAASANLVLPSGSS